MFFTYLSAVARRARPLRTPMLVVVVSALLALLFTFATQPSPEPERAAGEAKIDLVKDEHALVADLVRSLQDKVEAERLAAQQSRAEMRMLALAEQSAPAVIAQPTKPATARVALPPPKPAPAIEPPLPLQVATASPPPQKPVVARTRAALAAVQRIPSWLRAGVENVADWAVTAPSKAISQLPERRFL